MKITITAKPAEDLHEDGKLTAEAYDELVDTLNERGYDDVQITEHS